MIILYVFLIRDPADKIQTEAFKLGLPEAEQRKMSQLAGKPPANIAFELEKGDVTGKTPGKIADFS
jgi:hypothetical protein